MRLLINLSLIALSLVFAISCGGGGGGSSEAQNQTAQEQRFKLRMAGGKDTDIINIYFEDGTLVSSHAYNTGSIDVNLNKLNNYILRVEIGGVEVFESLITSADLNTAQNGILAVQANASTTLEVWEIQSGLNFDQNLTVPRERIVEVITGMITKALDSGVPQTASSWNDTKVKVMTALSINASYSDIKTAAAAVRDNININALITGVTLKDLNSIQSEQILISLQDGNTAAFYTAQTSAQSLLTSAKALLTSTGILTSNHLDPVTSVDMQIAENNYLEAYSRFHAASILSNSEEANFYTGLLRILSLPFRTDRQTISALDTLGLSLGSWFQYPHEEAEKEVEDTRLKYQDTAFPTPTEIKAIADSMALNEIIGAIDNFNQLSTGFALTLTKELQGNNATSDIDFDIIDIQAMLSWLYLAKSKLEYVLAYNLDIAGKTDLGTNMRTFITQMSGDQAFEGTATIDVITIGGLTIQDGFSQIALRAGSGNSLFLSFPNNSVYPEIELKASTSYSYNSGSYSSQTIYQGSSSFLEENMKKSIQFNLGFNDSSFNSFQAYYCIKGPYAYGVNKKIKNASVFSGLSKSTVSALTDADQVSFFNNNPSLAEADQNFLNLSKESMVQSVSLFNSAIDLLQQSSSNRSYHVIPEITEFEKDNGVSFTSSEIDNLQKLSNSFSSSLNGSTSLQPSLINSTLPTTNVNLSSFFNSSIRNYLQFGNAIVEENTTATNTLVQNFVPGSGETREVIENKLKELSDSLDFFMSDTKFWISYGSLYWNDVKNATAYTVYYKQNGSVTKTDYTDKLSVTPVSTSSYYSSSYATLSDLNLTDLNQVSIAVTATINGQESSLIPLTQMNTSTTYDFTYLTNINTLYYSGSTTPVLNTLTKLNGLTLASSVITVDLSNNSSLETLHIQFASEVTLTGFNQLTNLEYLNVFATTLTGLDLSNSNKLKSLSLSSTTNLSTLDLSNNHKLKELYLSSTNISAITLSQLSAGIQAQFYYNSENLLSNITNPSAIYNLSFANLQTSTNFVDISLNGYTNLKTFNLNSGKFNSIDFSNSPVRKFSTYGSNIKTVDLSLSSVHTYSASSADVETLNFHSDFIRNVGINYSNVNTFTNGVSPSLYELSVSASSSYSIGAVDLTGLSNLKRISLNTPNTNQSYDFSQNKELRYIDAYPSSDISISSLSKLKQLNINKYSNSTSGNFTLSDLNSLEQVYIYGYFDQISGLNNITSLSSLSINNLNTNTTSLDLSSLNLLNTFFLSSGTSSVSFGELNHLSSFYSDAPLNQTSIDSLFNKLSTTEVKYGSLYTGYQSAAPSSSTSTSHLSNLNWTLSGNGFNSF